MVTTMKFYALKHKVHGFMPQARRDKGYSHWPDQEMEMSLGTPRLFAERKNAVLSRSQWVRGITSAIHRGTEDEEVRTKDIGRKKEDLEVVELFVGEALPPVEGNLLPELGEKVKIHLASSNEWVDHEVVGFYIWKGLDGSEVPRICVRVKDENGYLNARSLVGVKNISENA